MSQIVHTPSVVSGAGGVTTLQIMPHTPETGTLQLIVVVVSALPTILNTLKQIIQLFKKRDNEKVS